MRESPALDVIQYLRLKNYQIAVHDPHVKAQWIIMDPEEAVLNADLIVVLTDHDEFRNLDHEKLSSLMRRPMIFDAKNIVHEQETSIMKVVNYGNVNQYIDLLSELVY